VRQVVTGEGGAKMKMSPVTEIWLWALGVCVVLIVAFVATGAVP